MRLLGFSACYHDSAAALVEDGRILAAVQEERFTRKKHDPAFPRHAIEYCLSHTKNGAAGIDRIICKLPDADIPPAGWCVAPTADGDGQ